jgi:P pilus assembly chaperone PapD
MRPSSIRLPMLLLALLPSLAAALSLSPTRLEVDLRASAVAEVELRIGGRPDRVQHVELSLLERLVDERVAPVAVDSISIELQPPQLVIEPGGHGVVRVVARRASGSAAASRSYYLVVEPVEIADPATGTASADDSRIQFVPRLHLPLHVDLGGQPASSIRRIADAQPQVEEDADGVGGEIEIVNRGSRYQRLATLRAVGPVDALAGRELARRARTDAVLPGQRLRIPLKAGELAGEPLGLFVVPEP